MKRFILFVTVVMVSMTIHAQFFTQMSLMTPHYYPGEVYFKDGHHEEFAEIELPRVGKNKLGVKKYADEKKHTDIEAIDIIGIKIWHKDFPDKTHILYYVNARKSMMQSEHQWGNPVMGSAWGIVYQCEQNYQMNKKTGELEIIKFTGGNAPDTPTLFYLMRSGWDQAELVMWNGSFMAIKKAAAKLFEEKPEISEGIKKGKLKGSDMQYILDQMAGGQKVEEPALIIPEAQTDSVSNGEAGDDE